MTEHGDERREEVAAKFRAVGGRWHEFRGLCDPRGPLWFQCFGCHRLRTIALAGDGAKWRCDACGWEGSPADIWLAQTDLLVDLCEVPECPGAVRRVLSDCGRSLHQVSQGDQEAIAASADLARRTLRVLDLWGFHEEWYYETD